MEHGESQYSGYKVKQIGCQCSGHTVGWNTDGVSIVDVRWNTDGVERSGYKSTDMDSVVDIMWTAKGISVQ